MKKKVLVLGAVTCVAGIVTAAGCSSSETVTTTTDASSDVTSERKPLDSGPEEDAGQCPPPQDPNKPITADTYDADTRRAIGAGLQPEVHPRAARHLPDSTGPTMEDA